MRFLQRVGLANSGQVMSERIQSMEFLILLGKRNTLLQKCNLWDSFPGRYFEFFFFNFRTPVLSSLFDFVCFFLCVVLGFPGTLQTRSGCELTECWDQRACATTAQLQLVLFKDLCIFKSVMQGAGEMSQWLLL